MRLAYLFLALFFGSYLFADKKPNILIFLVDDMGLMDTSVPFITDNHGKEERHPLNDFYKTPNMERLAKQGIRFSEFYAMSVCSPTRLSIITGQTSARHHTTQFIGPDGNNAGTYGPPTWQWEGVSPNHTVLPKLMKEAGYQTLFCGKAHFGPVGHFGEFPEKFGFDVNIAGCAYGRPGSYLASKQYGNNRKTGKGFRGIPGLEQYHNTDTFLTEALTLEMNKALTKAVKKEEPFFVYMSHYAVHSPFEVDVRFEKNYNSDNKKLNAFATLVEGMDKSLGDIMDHLDKLGVAEETLILFLGDNGTDAPIGPIHEIACSAPLRGKKGTHYEGGMRVPFIAAWAKNNPNHPLQQKNKIAPGTIIQQLGNVNDILPTVLDFAKVEAPKNIDGISISSYFNASKEKTEREFLMHFPHSHRSSYFTAYRKGDWKLIYHYPTPKSKFSTELFNLAKDRDESQNLSNSHPEKLSQMMSAMLNSLERTGAQYPLSQDKKSVLKPKL